MNEQRNKLSSRDYKHGGRGGPTLLQRYQQFLGGLALGLFVALVVYLTGRHPQVPAVEEPAPAHVGKSNTEVVPDTEDPPTKYDFYEMLPNFEVT